MHLTTGLFVYIFLLVTITTTLVKIRNGPNFRTTLLKNHCWFGYVTGVFALAHVYGQLNIRISLGYISLVLLLITLISGIMFKYVHKPINIRGIHMSSAVITLVMVILHLIQNLYVNYLFIN